VLVSARRVFQIPQLFRPTVSAVLANTVGHVNLETPARGLSSIASWVQFSRWCRMHPVPRPAAGGKIRKDRAWLHGSVIQQEGLDLAPIIYLEFGVYRGDSLRWWLDRVPQPQSRFVGFDTFTGLPEWWRATEPAGHFNADGRLPDIKDLRCSFQKGLFQETLPRFVSDNDLSGRLVINLDADMYTSTLFVLTTLGRVLKAGDILFFDEFSCPLDEFRAFEEFVRSFRVKYGVLGAVQAYTRVCIKIL
jgi:O-methyltransferase